MAQSIEITAPDIFGIGGPWRVIRFGVPNHSEVTTGDIIAELDGPNATVEIDTCESGKIEFVAQIDQVIEPNQLIANVLSPFPQNGLSLQLNIPPKQLRILDDQRSDESRHDFLLSLIDSLAKDANGENDEDTEPDKVPN